MIVELKVHKEELQQLIAHRVWEKMEKQIDAEDVKFKCDFDQVFEYAHVDIDLGE